MKVKKVDNRTMWHEARKQERKIRGLMVDFRRRADRRRDYYEKVKLDPTQFLRIYGRPMKIHLERSVAIAAEGPQSMMPWQGDRNNMIDRFDVRANLDIIPDKKRNDEELDCTGTLLEEQEEHKCNYERYRTLVQNDCSGLTEDQCLNQIATEEQFGTPGNSSKVVEEEKKKSALADSRAAIGYTYEDSTDPLSIPPAEAGLSKHIDNSDDSGDESDTSLTDLDLDIVLDPDTLTKEQRSAINECAIEYGMGCGDYMNFLEKDKEDRETLRRAKLAEEEKAQFSGRKSRRERRALKEKKIMSRKISPPSYAARDSPKYEPFRRSSSSRSRSNSPVTKVSFITTFGGESSDDEKKPMQGPALPPHLQKNTDNKISGDSKSSEARKNSRSPKKYRRSRSSRSRSSSKSRSSTRKRSYRSYSRSRSRSRSSHYRRSRSSSYRRRRYSNSRSRSRSRSRRRSYYSRSRSRSPRYRRSYSRSRSRSRSRRRSYGRRYRRSRSRSWSRSQSRSRSRSYDRRRSNAQSQSQSSKEKRSRSKSKERQSVVPQVKRYRRAELESDNSSDSDTNLKRTPSYSRTGNGNKKDIKPLPKPFAPSVGKLSVQDKMKKRMQAALTKTFKADKKAEIEKRSKQEQERMDREEELRTMALQMRKRERDRRHREQDHRHRGSSCSSSDSERSKSRSPYLRRHRSKSRSYSPPGKQSSSRSRSSSPSSIHQRIVNY